MSLLLRSDADSSEGDGRRATVISSVGPLVAAALIQYASMTAPVWIPTPPPETPEMGDRVKAVYVHRVPARPRAADYPSGPVAPVFVPTVTLEPLTWKPTHPDRLDRRTLPVSAHRSLSEAPYQQPQFFESGGQIIATGSIRNLLQYQSLSAPIVVEAEGPPPALVPVLFAPQATLTPLRALHPSRVQAWAIDTQWTAPAAPTVPDLAVTPIPQMVRRVYPRATYTLAQQHFANMVQVPVMSWTGLYLDPPVRRSVRYQPDHRPFPLDFDVTINPPAPVRGWDGSYPERTLRAKPRQQGAFAAPLYIADVTTGAVVARSWAPVYDDIVRAARRLHASANPAWFSDKFTAPTPVVVPDKAQPVYVDRVHGRKPNVHSASYMAPEFVPDVTNPVTPLAWLAQYPDYIWTKTLPVALKPFYRSVVFIAEYIPPVIIHEIEGRASYDRKLYGRSSSSTTIRGRGSL